MLAAIVILPLAAFAAGKLSYEAYENDAKIFYNGKEIDFQLPVVTINGNTYVPLRETAEKTGVAVNWNGYYQRICLARNIQGIDAKEAFNSLFKIELPNSAEVLSYEYYDDILYEDRPEKHFAAKISFDEEDLEYVKSQFSDGWFEDYTEEELDEELAGLAGINARFVKVFSKEYEWWDLADPNDVLYTYWTYMSGTYVKTIVPRVFISQSQEGQYYLYVNYH